MTDENDNFRSDLVQVTRLALGEQTEDVRLFVARLVRKYRTVDTQLSEQLETYLRTKPTRGASSMRKVSAPSPAPSALPVDDESRLSLLKVFDDKGDQADPLLTDEVKDALSQMVQERRQIDRLRAVGLSPTRSAIFVGPPGVGKTLTARWLAAQLRVPFYVLDLTAVMSSLLGKSGSNLRAAIDFAKREPCVLLLDEIDAIAKRRSDDTDIGELKRLVTVILQEVDEWPSSSVLLAATNHSELIDPALWRRFDLIVNFEMPDEHAVRDSIKRFLGSDFIQFSRWIDILVLAFRGHSFSDIERELQRFRRAIALGMASSEDLIEGCAKTVTSTLDRQGRIELAVLLSNETRMSQHSISGLTGVSRDTIRKYVSETSTSRKAIFHRKAEA